MRIITPGIAATAALLVAALPAFAQDGPPWTVEEFLSAHPDLTEDAVAQIDTDGDGSVSEAEYEAAVTAGLVAPSEG